MVTSRMTLTCVSFSFFKTFSVCSGVTDGGNNALYYDTERLLILKEDVV